MARVISPAGSPGLRGVRGLDLGPLARGTDPPVPDGRWRVDGRPLSNGFCVCGPSSKAQHRTGVDPLGGLRGILGLAQRSEDRSGTGPRGIESSRSDRGEAIVGLACGAVARSGPRRVRSHAQGSRVGRSEGKARLPGLSVEWNPCAGCQPARVRRIGNRSTARSEFGDRSRRVTQFQRSFAGFAGGIARCDFSCIDRSVPHGRRADWSKRISARFDSILAGFHPIEIAPYRFCWTTIRRPSDGARSRSLVGRGVYDSRVHLWSFSGCTQSRFDHGRFPHALGNAPKRVQSIGAALVVGSF